MEEKLGKDGRNNRDGVDINDLMKSKKDIIEIRLFKKSLYYKALEQASLMGEDLQFKENASKYDLDSEDGQSICKNYISCLERLFSILKLKVAPRDYRDKFSKAYKVLY